MLRKVAAAVEAVEAGLEVETDVTVGKIDLLETITHNSSQQYALLSDIARPAVQAAEEMHKARAEFVNQAGSQLDGAEKIIEYYEHVATEITEWIGELDVKTRRLLNADRTRS